GPFLPFALNPVARVTVALVVALSLVAPASCRLFAAAVSFGLSAFARQTPTVRQLEFRENDLPVNLNRTQILGALILAAIALGLANGLSRRSERYLDFTSGQICSTIGHNHPQLAATLTHAVGSGMPRWFCSVF
ncbi:hypothetical protein B4Q13_22855, partial [Lacticaseibacillus rhamnosus]